MRRLVVAGIIAIAAHGAEAADLPDMPILRGSFREAPVAYRTIWQGFYVGGQAGYGASNVDFGDFNSGLIERLTADPAVLQGLPFAPPPWPSLEPATHRNTMFGAFAGYNAQYENVVLGFEGNYMHGTFSGSAFGRNTFLRLAATLVSVSTESAASMRITDLGPCVYEAATKWGAFFPICLRVSAWAGRHHSTCCDHPNRTSDKVSHADTNKQFVHGFAAGAGVDWMLFGGMFLRAEYEYLQFTSSLNTNIHSVRGGLGYKFNTGSGAECSVSLSFKNRDAGAEGRVLVGLPRDVML